MKGISVLVIPTLSKGFSWRRILNSGRKASRVSFIELDHVLIPVENLIGEENEGFRIVVTNFNKVNGF